MDASSTLAATRRKGEGRGVVLKQRRCQFGVDGPTKFTKFDQFRITLLGFPMWRRDHVAHSIYRHR